MTPQTIKECFLLNMGTSNNDKRKHVWRILVHVMVWSIWLERNKRIFEDIEESVEDLWSKIKLRLAWWINGRKKFRGSYISDVIRSLNYLLYMLYLGTPHPCTLFSY